MMKMSFQEAFAELKQNTYKTITRETWNFKMWIGTHIVGSTQYFYLITPNKQTNSLDVKQLENINIEDIMANDWMAM